MNKIVKFLSEGSFLLGFLMAFDFTGRIGNTEVQKTVDLPCNRKADVESIAGDWSAVGASIADAMKEVPHEQ